MSFQADSLARAVLRTVVWRYQLWVGYNRSILEQPSWNHIAKAMTSETHVIWTHVGKSCNASNRISRTLNLSWVLLAFPKANNQFQCQGTLYTGEKVRNMSTKITGGSSTVVAYAVSLSCSER